MRITALAVDAFGVWNDLRIERVSPGLNVFYGANEAGKTTLMQFVRTVLYGFSRERRARYLPPLAGHPAGGALFIEDRGDALILKRGHANHDGERAETFAVLGADGLPRAADRLSRLLKEIDEPVFNNVFALGLRDLQELGTLSDTRASELLFRIAAGLDRVSLFEVLGELDNSRNRLLAADDRPSEIVHLLGQKERLKGELHDLSPLAGQYGDVVAEQTELDESIGKLERDKQAFNVELSRYETAERLIDPWQKRARLDAQLRPLESLPALPADALARLDKLSAARQKWQARLSQLRPQRRELESRLARLHVNEPFWREAAKVDAFCDQREWIAELERQKDEVAASIDELNGQIKGHWQRLGLTGTPATATDKNFLTPLKQAARERAERRMALKAAEEKARQAREAAAALDQQVVGGLAGRDGQSLSAELERAGNLVTQLRRRLQLDERAEQVARHAKELEEDRHDYLDRELMPAWIIGGLCVVFAIGVALLLAGAFMPFAGTVGLWLAGGGLLGTAGAGAAKYMLEHHNQTQLEQCERQMKLCRSQIKQNDEERADLDRQLPAGGGPITQRLQTAEKELAAIEELVPLDTRRQSFVRDLETTGKSLEQARADYAAADALWHEALSRAGLPTNLPPKQLRWLSRSHRKLRDLEERLAGRQQEHSLRDRAVRQFRERLTPLLEVSGVGVRPRSVSDHLGALGEALAKERETADQRDQLQAENAKLRRTIGKLVRLLKRNEARHRRLLERCGVETEADLRSLAEQHALRDGLCSQRSAVQEHILLVLGERFGETEMAALLNSADAVERFAARLAGLAGQIAQIDGQIKKLAERRGELNERRKTLVADRRLANKQLELGVVQERLRRAIERWQVLGVTHTILEKLRRAYEKERQPETLRQASIYFERLTGGRYSRVWTPLGEPVLRVDDGQGHALPVDVLSRGTREQLFLALRLALLKSYAARGIELPLVMDDLLVNFDADRALASARLLCEFAGQGHQILVFTCHDHIRRMFHSLGVAVQVLPRGAAPPEIGPRAAAVEPPPEIVVEIEEEEPAPIEVDEEPEPQRKTRRIDRPAKPARRPPRKAPVQTVVATPEPQPQPARVIGWRNGWDAQEFSGEFTERPVVGGGPAIEALASGQIRSGYWLDRVTRPAAPIAYEVVEGRVIEARGTSPSSSASDEETEQPEPADAASDTEAA